MNSIKYSFALTMAVYQVRAEETGTCKTKEIKQANSIAKKKALNQRQGANMSSIYRSYLWHRHACPRQDETSLRSYDRYPHQHRRHWVHKITKDDTTRTDATSMSCPLSTGSSSLIKMRMIRSPTTTSSMLQISSQKLLSNTV